MYENSVEVTDNNCFYNLLPESFFSITEFSSNLQARENLLAPTEFFPFYAIVFFLYAY